VAPREADAKRKRGNIARPRKLRLKETSCGAPDRPCGDPRRTDGKDRIANDSRGERKRPDKEKEKWFRHKAESLFQQGPASKPIKRAGADFEEGEPDKRNGTARVRIASEERKMGGNGYPLLCQIPNKGNAPGLRKKRHPSARVKKES